VLTGEHAALRPEQAALGSEHGALDGEHEVLWPEHEALWPERSFLSVEATLLGGGELPVEPGLLRYSLRVMASLPLRHLLGPDLAVDLGSATARVASAWGRLTLEAPSAIGATRALRGGVVVAPDCAAEILRPLFARIRRFGLVRPRAGVDLRGSVRSMRAHGLRGFGVSS
jgi:hypothetical protein